MKLYTLLNRTGLLLLVVLLPLVAMLGFPDLSDECRYRFVRSSWTAGACTYFLLWGGFRQGRARFRGAVNRMVPLSGRLSVRLVGAIYTLSVSAAAILLAAALYDMAVVIR